MPRSNSILTRSTKGEDAEIWEYQERRGGSGGGDEVGASPKASPGSESHFVAFRGFLNPLLPKEFSLTLASDACEELNGAFL